MPFPFKLASGTTPRAIVFDLDETLINCDSTELWTDWLYETGTITDPVYREVTDRMINEYYAGTLDIRTFLRDVTPAIANLSKDELDALIERFIECKILPRVYPKGRELIERAHRAGLPVVIISATATYLVKPIAKMLGVSHAIGIDLVMQNNVPTGHVEGTPSFREGKITRLHEWLAHQNETIRDRGQAPVTPQDVFFFTDSRNDLPLIYQAGGCALVNPDDVVRAEGQKKGWPILEWKCE